MDVIKITPRGYCYGVVDAMTIATRAASQPELPRPIYILGMIVHNQHVVDAYEKLGVITLDGANRLDILEKVDRGTVIFTAHGVSNAVRARAKEKGLHVIDATCPDVTKTHRLIEERVKEGYKVVYIGKHGHPEPEGAVGVAPDHVRVVESIAEVDALPAEYGVKDGGRKLLVTNQTTMSQWDTEALVEALVARFPEAEVCNEICDATSIRQNAVAEQARQADLCIVVGDPKSNNSARLAQVAREIAGVPAYRIASVQELDPSWLCGVKTVAVTSGASTPTAITRQVVAYLEDYDEQDVSTHALPVTLPTDRVLPQVSFKPVSHDD
ncbi:4-hydroxy-3-methylbut-2-enyl diphosphate reductase [Ferroacidibacillus organovorans]|uniref:4-hydroxy-3-methylbut-2-enyl diphosphate reductase n=1 Tax=Ferroacidibacillus organovorans TaxID=1765683 RepID=A0A101XP78_9BACL|nr:4-hydroxy-3-methylbut-2-enyl diphosphate reductase [Ferroacidibacillus organovorans]KUO95020.1 4-hydroxy-3-methylbut-2-enyl diphosphate reductase [Ferroacidibacillus organovorans]